jgi:hypothetical protein
MQMSAINERNRLPPVKKKEIVPNDDVGNAKLTVAGSFYIQLII